MIGVRGVDSRCCVVEQRRSAEHDDDQQAWSMQALEEERPVGVRCGTHVAENPQQPGSDRYDADESADRQYVRPPADPEEYATEREGDRPPIW